MDSPALDLPPRSNGRYWADEAGSPGLRAMTNARPGRILLINGTSSSGKTTLVKGLQSTLPDLWLEMGIDRFAYALPGRVADSRRGPSCSGTFDRGGSDGPFTIETTALGQRFISGMHATAAALARPG